MHTVGFLGSAYQIATVPGTGWKQDWVWEETELKCSTKSLAGLGRQGRGGGGVL